MDKKTLAYILIGAGVVAAGYYLYTKSKSAAATASLGAGTIDKRGAWAADDDALYQELRGMMSTSDLAWLDPLVKASYEGSGCDANTTIQGQQSKALNFFCRIAQTGPNVNGKYPAWVGPDWHNDVPSLWPQTLLDTMFTKTQALKVKYGAL